MNKSLENGALRNVKLLGDQQHSVANQDGTITVHIPISFKKHGGRKYIISPDATPEAYTPPVEKNSVLLKGRQPKYLTLTDLLKPFPLDWNEQREQLGFLGAAH